MTRVETGYYMHDKYGKVRVVRACSLVHFDTEEGERKAELTDLFQGNAERL